MALNTFSSLSIAKYSYTTEWLKNSPTDGAEHRYISYTVSGDSLCNKNFQREYLAAYT